MLGIGSYKTGDVSKKKKRRQEKGDKLKKIKCAAKTE